MELKQVSLWGPVFTIPEQATTVSKVQAALENPKEVKRVIASKKLSIEEKLILIKAEVNRILGKYKDDTILIKTKAELKQYIDKAIENKIIAIDTETNNSLDPITCKLMGPCIYTPGMKNAYIPINHVDLKTGERLDWQLTEQDVYEEFKRLDGIEIITHNGKFDYEVLYCTIGWKMPVTWDTMIAARLLDENEKASLKEQYRTKMDPAQEKYDIEHLFAKLEYAIIDPELFALYAATDSFMTYKLYEWQKKQFEDPDLAKVYKLYTEVELPVMFVSAQMELDGICFDFDYCERLKLKYNRLLDNVNAELDKELATLAPKISAWRLTDDANNRPKSKINAKGKEIVQKTKNEQLKDPVELTSPTQLAILLYDILKCPVVDKKTPRGTGKEILMALAPDYSICKTLLKQRELLKLIDAFLESLPQKVSKKDGRLHAHFNQLGTDTGRFSCTDPNLQQIPSHNAEIRLLFSAATEEHDVEIIDNYYDISTLDEVQVDYNKWCFIKDLKIGDTLVTSENTYDIIKNIELINDKIYRIYV